MTTTHPFVTSRLENVNSASSSLIIAPFPLLKPPNRYIFIAITPISIEKARAEMGNCQAAEAATVVIQHGGNRVERIYWSVSANEIMASNPGHYVAMVIASPAVRTTENGTPVKQLKLLRPEDTLLLGQVYRLVSFEGPPLNYTRFT